MQRCKDDTVSRLQFCIQNSRINLHATSSGSTAQQPVYFSKPVTFVQKDSWAIDYQATLNTLEAAQEAGASHFVLLSAICVQKPLLEFQHAKLKFEEALQSAQGITHSIVRPTAFFKSLAGQVTCARPLVFGPHHTLPHSAAPCHSACC